MTETRRSGATVSAVLLLSHWWSRPTEEERDVWSALWEAAAETTASLRLDGDALDRLQEAFERSETLPLEDEYERLLVGPGRPPCAPYESLWRTDLPAAEQGTLMGPTADAVASIYRDLGLGVSTDAGNELPDHLLLECEALAYALEQDSTAPADELLRVHLARWVPRFCDAVAAEAAEPFYVALAELTSAWIVTLTA